MIRRAGLISIMVAAVTAVTIVAAFAGQTNGQGKTFLGNSLGFNAQSDLSGNLDYHFTDINNNDVDMHCNDYSRYIETTTPGGNYPKTIVNSNTCVNKATDEPLHLHAEFVDRGEGSNAKKPDGVCISVVDSNGIKLIRDCGFIQKGNVQIHTGVAIFDDSTA